MERTERLEILEAQDTKQSIYDEICRVLTYYEHHKERANEFEDLYHMLVKIQNRWEDVITAYN